MLNKLSLFMFAAFISSSALADDFELKIGNGLGFSKDIGLNYGAEFVVGVDEIVNHRSTFQVGDEGARIQNRGNVLFFPLELFGATQHTLDCSGLVCNYDPYKFDYLDYTSIGLSVVEYDSMIIRQGSSNIMKNEIGPSINANYLYANGSTTFMAVGNFGPKFQHLKSNDQHSLGMALSAGGSLNGYIMLNGWSYLLVDVGYNAVLPIIGADGLGQEVQANISVNGAKTYVKLGYVYQNFNFDLDTKSKIDYFNHSVGLIIGYNF
jgi:hypothetical protein